MTASTKAPVKVGTNVKASMKSLKAKIKRLNVKIAKQGLELEENQSRIIKICNLWAVDTGEKELAEILMQVGMARMSVTGDLWQLHAFVHSELVVSKPQSPDIKDFFTERVRDWTYPDFVAFKLKFDGIAEMISVKRQP